MPELPEVECVRRSLLPLLGRRCVAVRVVRPDVIEPQTRARSTRRSTGAVDPRRLLLGATIARLERHGKHLGIVSGAGLALDIQLGMTGQVLVWEKGQPPDSLTHLHVIWDLDNGSAFGFRDPRRFGGIWPADSLESLRRGRWSQLGPDGLSLTASSLRERLASSRRPIKLALMDQGVVAGLGNIYVAEALFDARISPLRRCHRLSVTEVNKLAGSIRDVLRAAVKAGGSTLRDYANANGAPGTFQRSHKVYGRGDEVCVCCGKALRHRAMGQRSTVWCPACQR